MTRVPFQLKFEVVPDDTGLTFGKAVANFLYYYDEDHNAVVSDRVCLTIEGDSLKLMDNLFETILKAAIDKHKCCSKEEALKKFQFTPGLEHIPTPAVADVVEAPDRIVEAPVLMAAPPQDPPFLMKVKDFILGR